ncbi:metallophosphoesterase [Paenalkalicoccus suaedae]|uniref:Metallophosphoesterase n=1 Tax=Paenalkalicoccus suaedae TaxID=2592382 RepID=A0A859FKG4_9BACI|nr:metallophosphoesterase [Paenalkalicoccus suaedae]QKS73273.1 metallophosphoesterase [Paenalkalicoccus suaedae]
MMYDIIGDIHGCKEELLELLHKLGYDTPSLQHNSSRTPIFLGDLTDRGPESIETIKLVSTWVKNGLALYCPGNHCNKLYRYFLGNKVQITHGLETTVEELHAIPSKERENIATMFKELYESAPLYLKLNQLVIAHAGIRYDFIGSNSGRVKRFALYGDITGEFDEKGRPIRRDWPSLYPQGEETVVYGHTPVMEPRVIGNTVNIDTGCVFGNKLTAYQYPEATFVSVPSKQPFHESYKEKFPFDF